MCAGADAINEAADAAEKVTTEVNQLVAGLAQGSHDSDAVEDAFEQRYCLSPCHVISQIHGLPSFQGTLLAV